MYVKVSTSSSMRRDSNSHRASQAHASPTHIRAAAGSPACGSMQAHLARDTKPYSSHVWSAFIATGHAWPGVDASRAATCWYQMDRHRCPWAIVVSAELRFDLPSRARQHLCNTARQGLPIRPPSARGIGAARTAVCVPSKLHLLMGYKVPEVKSKHFQKYVDQMPSCESKVYAITGTTTGMGFHAMKVLTLKGAHVLALNRPSERSTSACQQARDQCSADESAGRVTEVSCDLQSFEAVRAAGAEVLSVLEGKGLDALVCNAGVMAMPDKATVDGYDVQMQTNHLSHFLLASLLFPSLQTAASVSGSARIVGHSSAARKRPRTPCNGKYYGKSGGDLGGDQAMVPRWERYHQSKLANVLFSGALKDQLEERGITNILCVTAVPGLAASNLQATTAEHGGGMGLQMLMRFAQSAEDGTLPLLECITSADMQSGDMVTPGNNGPISWMFGDAVVGWPKKKEVEKLCNDEASKKTLWEESEKAVGPFFAA
eukprot:jgi/Ulvmu1/280/UM001_0284.1